MIQINIQSILEFQIRWSGMVSFLVLLLISTGLMAAPLLQAAGTGGTHSGQRVATPLKVGDLQLDFPKFMEISVNGKTVFKDPPKVRPYSGPQNLKLAETPHHILLIPTRSGMDFTFTRLIILSKEGEFILEKRLLPEIETFKFKNKLLTYWSEWLCHNMKPVFTTIPVHTWQGRGEVNMKTIPREEKCSNEALARSKKSKLIFREIRTPWSHGCHN